MPLKTCRYCLADIETESKVRHPVCSACWQKRQIQAVRTWKAGLGKTRERRTSVYYEIKAVAYYPWKLDPSVVLVVEP